MLAAPCWVGQMGQLHLSMWLEPLEVAPTWPHRFWLLWIPHGWDWEHLCSLLGPHLPWGHGHWDLPCPLPMRGLGIVVAQCHGKWAPPRCHYPESNGALRGNLEGCRDLDSRFFLPLYGEHGLGQLGTKVSSLLAPQHFP